MLYVLIVQSCMCVLEYLALSRDGQDYWLCLIPPEASRTSPDFRSLASVDTEWLLIHLYICMCVCVYNLLATSLCQKVRCTR